MKNEAKALCVFLFLSIIIIVIVTVGAGKYIKNQTALCRTANVAEGFELFSHPPDDVRYSMDLGCQYLIYNDWITVKDAEKRQKYMVLTRDVIESGVYYSAFCGDFYYYEPKDTTKFPYRDRALELFETSYTELGNPEYRRVIELYENNEVYKISVIEVETCDDVSIPKP